MLFNGQSVDSNIRMHDPILLPLAIIGNLFYLPAIPWTIVGALEFMKCCFQFELCIKKKFNLSFQKRESIQFYNIFDMWKKEPLEICKVFVK